MKTIYTTLPIYDKLAKQAYERAKHAGMDKPIPIACPKHRLPSFQWKDDGDGATSVSKIELVSQEFDTTREDPFYGRTGDVLFSSWASHPFDTSYIENGIYFHGVNVGVGGWGVVSPVFNLTIGDEVRIYGSVTGAAGGYPFASIHPTIPYDLALKIGGISLTNGIVDVSLTASATGATYIQIAGLGPIDLTITTVTITKTKNIKDITADFPVLPGLSDDYFTYFGTTLLRLMTAGVYYLIITTNNAKIYYSEYFLVDCVYGADTGLPPSATYSEIYLIINFSNACNLGDIYYEGGLTQTLWFKSEPMEASFPQEEEGAKNGEGQFVRTFARQVKKYLVRTGTMPDYMVDVFNRMKLHDTIELTDLVGDTNDVYNLEVEHEWLNTDKYYAKIELTFDYDETVVILASCI
jgi:hypothetical protein